MTARMVELPPATGKDARELVSVLLAARARGSTVCPSEVARALADGAAADDWRGRMAEVHAAVDRLVAAGTVRLSWKDRHLPVRSGPYRIGRAADADR